jgi:hypothetical protein
MTNINSEIMMILISIIALFLTILAGFGGIVTFLWNQFGKIHQTLGEIKLEYVQKQECMERRANCDCVKKMSELEKKLQELEDDFEGRNRRRNRSKQSN